MAISGTTGLAVQNVVRALRVAALLAQADATDMSTLNLVPDAPNPEKIDIRDAARIMRKVKGLEP